WETANGNKTALTYKGAQSLEAGTPGGKMFHFGIREHGMAAIVNGLSLSKLRPVRAAYVIFRDYARPAIPLSPLMELRGAARVRAAVLRRRYPRAMAALDRHLPRVPARHRGLGHRARRLGPSLSRRATLHGRAVHRRARAARVV